MESIVNALTKAMPAWVTVFVALFFAITYDIFKDILKDRIIYFWAKLKEGWSSKESSSSIREDAQRKSINSLYPYRDQEVAFYIKFLRDNPDKIDVIRHAETRTRLRGIWFCLIAIIHLGFCFFWLLVNQTLLAWFFGFFGFFLLVPANTYISISMDYQAAIMHLTEIELTQTKIYRDKALEKLRYYEQIIVDIERLEQEAKQTEPIEGIHC